MKTFLKTALIAAALMSTSPMLAVRAIAAGTIYLDKLDKKLDRRWNALDEACRGAPYALKACTQRLALDKVIIAKGCINIYPAQDPKDTSYWKCRRKQGMEASESDWRKSHAIDYEDDDNNPDALWQKSHR